MFPTVDECTSYTDEEREALIAFDAALRIALLHARAESEEIRSAGAQSAGDSRLGAAFVTVMLTVAADAAMLAVPTSNTPQLSEFLDAAKDAFDWSQKKRARF